MAIFDGKPSAIAGFSTWYSRLEAKIRQLGPNYGMVLGRTGVFKGIKYDTSGESKLLISHTRNEVSQALETPIARKLEMNNTKKKVFTLKK